MKFIPFNKPFLTGNEFLYVQQAINRGHISGNGDFTKLCHDYFHSRFKVTQAFLTTSCTHALEITAILLDLQPGDEVIVPSFTFVSTANAFVMHGGTPRFIDIRPDTLNLDESQLASLINEKTRAVVPVHYAGIACEMDIIMEIAREHDLVVIEDNAHGLFGQYHGRDLGTIGSLAAHSFHETKNITCGEGGVLFINDPVFRERAEIIWEKGTNRSMFFRGQTDKYSWIDCGSSYLPSDILAAYLYAQLESCKTIQEIRAKIWNQYYVNLKDWADENKVQLPYVPDYCQQSYHMFYMVMPTAESRGALLEYMNRNMVNSVFHYLPLHLSKMGRRFWDKKNPCPVTEDISQRLIRLPFHNQLTENEINDVVQCVKDFQFF